MFNLRGSVKLKNLLYFQVPVEFCKTNGIRIGRVPSYSPSSIAEYAISSIMALAKNIQKSYELTKDADFTIGGLQVIEKWVGFKGSVF
jgi:D-lactate dehydrogenase